MISRRRVLQLSGGAFASLAALGGFAATSRANAYYAGPVSDHFDGTHFFNPQGKPPRALSGMLRLYVTETWAPWPGQVETGPRAVPTARLSSETLGLTFVGHASWLVQTGGLNVLVDPVWSERASPVSFAGPKRVTAPGIAFDDLPRIDAVLLTHNHYDHMDMPTLRRLWDRDRPRCVTPLGNDTILRSELPDFDTQVMDWNQTIDLAPGVRLTAVPALHWSARGMRDRRHALWASFVLEAPGGRVLIVGDSALGDGSLFTAIGDRFPALDVAVLPIGAYEPRWFMRDMHMNPADAVVAFQRLGAKVALGHHWGTFPLTAEARDRPPIDLAEALTRAGIAQDRFPAMHPGQTYLIGG